ncbi:hypothetical protein FBUS_09246 [Fasciolopsis buskii]|uniref:Pecanex-like protein n=1 Tax=Fasciolopsis buskii TaxID=27845 RepID=A0A8E0VP89_9TREM|nr:hypothetical protein FBUS_09246 [Fasciolopsis buski]
MMTKIIREDIVSSLTGGFYLDYQQTHFVNITHLYLWILFFVSPLVFHLVYPESFLATGVYSIAITVVVSLIKLITWRLHRLLDLKEPITETHDSQLLLTGLSQKDAEDNSVAHQHVLNDPDYEEVNTAFVQDIEERCRRIGQAGLAIAELEDSLRIDQGSSLAFPKNNTDEDNPFANSYTSTITEEKTRTEKEQPSFHKFDPFAATVGASLQRTASSHKPQKSPSDRIEKTNNGVEPNQSSDDNIHCSACHERQEITEAPKKSVGSGITYLPQSSHKIRHRRSPLSRHSTEPSNSVNSVITADLERCKRIISQLEAEVNRLPVRSDEPFVPSLKDLDVLKRPRPRSSLVSTCRRSYSQRHHRTILSSQIQTSRQQAIHLPCSFFHRQTVVPTELTELSLADTILYWRRNFASSSSHSDYRTFRSQSFHQSNLASGSHGRMDTEAVLSRHTGRRSHSLRYSHSIRSQLSTGCRHLPRRPGSALRLRSQQSVDYAFNSTRSNLLTFPDFVRPTSTGLPPRKTTVDLNNSSREPTADVGYQKRKTVILKVPSAESEFTSPALGGIDSPRQHSDATPHLRKSADDLDEDDTSNMANRQFTKLTNPVDDNFETSEPECASEKSVGTHSPRFARLMPSFVDRRTGLVRQYGIRRKFIIVPTHKGDSVLVSNRSEVVAHLSSTQPSITEQANTSAISNEEQPSGSTSSAAATVYVLLAQLMGVHSLAAAGLTRQQCLSQLRGSLGNEDSENAELDILFALTAAATNADEPNVEGNNAWDVSTNQSEWARNSERYQSTEERTKQLQDQEGQQSLSRVSTPGPSTAFVPRSPTVDPHTIIAERVSFPPADSNDVHLVRATETQSSTRNRRSIPQTRPFVRPRPLIRATRTRIQPKQIYVVRPFPLLPITLRLCLDRLQLDALFDRLVSLIVVYG